MNQLFLPSLRVKPVAHFSGPRDIMKLAVTYTLLPKIDLTDEELLDIGDRLIQSLPNYYNRLNVKGLKDIKYDIVCLTIGLHCDASRHHIHIGHLLETNNDKEIIHWDKTLRPLLLPFINSFKTKIDLKISFNNKVEETDILSVLAYPLKEYRSFNEIYLTKQFIGLTDKQIEEYRIFAHSKWLGVKQGKVKKDKDKRNTEETLENKWLWLDDAIVNKSLEFYGLNTDSKLRFIMCSLLHYHKDQYEQNAKRSFRISGIKETAMNYLYLKQIIDENDIFYLSKF